jgi:hypothetical protein
MDFKYDKKINKKAWESTLRHKEMFGMKFPNKVSIKKEDEILAKKRIENFSALWNKDKELRDGIFKIYGYTLPKILKCYVITTRTSAVYLERKCILLSTKAPSYNFYNPIVSTIIHEFSHIAFLDKWLNACLVLGYTKNGIQELKEILTVINNIEYKDIEDKGYSVHQKIREIVKTMWLGNKDLKEIISDPKIIESVNSLDTIKKR